jgi:molybdenum cofactor biosynthesis enzyme MoaA
LSTFHRFYDLGFREAHLTGGEPSWYPECEKLVLELHNMGLQVKMTSNGQFNAELLKRLANAGLYSINFSVHTLNPQHLAEIQAPQRSIEWGKKALETQLQNIRTAREMGLRVKINTVVQDSIEDATDVINFCRQEAMDLRLLNDLSLGSLSIEKIIEILQSLGAEIEGIGLVDGVSSYSCQVVTSTGFHFSVKAIRKCSLRTMCGYCKTRDQCQEWFYGIRIEQIGDRPMVRLCLHRKDFPCVQTIEDFFDSEQFDEIQQLVR